MYLLYNKMINIWHQILKKHTKLKYWFLRQKRLNLLSFKMFILEQFWTV